MKRWLLFVCGTASLHIVLTGVGHGESPTTTSTESQNWSLLIGVEKYQIAPPLRYISNDVISLSETLVNYGELKNACQIVLAGDDAARRPTRSVMQQHIAEFLKRPAPQDQVFVYFSGHGFRDAQRQLFLAPEDFNPQQPEETGIRVDWVRQQLAACRAGFKLLILDACHAGSEKSSSPPELMCAKEIGETFRDLNDVVTLASSTGNETSLVWDEREQSLFSYWLNRGLKGHADTNGDMFVDLDELHGYVHRHVTATARTKFSRSQTPVRIIRSGQTGVPRLVPVRPRSLKELLVEVAEQFANTDGEGAQGKIGVLQFTGDTKFGELLGGEFGSLGCYCADELERLILMTGRGNLSVIDRRRLQKAVQDVGFSIDDLGDPEALQRLSLRAGGMKILLHGTLRSRVGRKLTLQCKLCRLDSDDVVDSAGGTAQLTESEWGMLGRSAVVPPEARRPRDLGSSVVAVPDIFDSINEDGPHPLSDPSFPYRIALRVKGRECPVEFHGNDCVVALERDTVYEIAVENRSGQTVCMRLLVDGLNTLPQNLKLKGIGTEGWGQRVNLDEARSWVLDPAVATRFVVRGFVTDTGKAGKLREFTVVDAGESLAGRQQFTDQIGLITAAFYVPQGASQQRSGIAARSASTAAVSTGSTGGAVAMMIGTAAGQELADNLAEARLRPGKLLAVVHLRYVGAPRTTRAARP